MAPRLLPEGRPRPGGVSAAGLRAQPQAGPRLPQELRRPAQDRPRRCLRHRRAGPLRAPVAPALPARRPLRPAPAPHPLPGPPGADAGAREELLPDLPVPEVLRLRPGPPVQGPLRRDQLRGT